MDNRVTSGPTLAIDVCDSCGRRDWGSQKPRRCNGCKVMMYCDKECQKAAWKNHRIMCRSAPSSDLPLSPPDIGYSTPATAGRALHEWYVIHQWSLNAIMDAIIRLHGGIDALLASEPRRTLVFTAGAVESTENGGNPAKAFKLFNVSIVEGEEHYAIEGRNEEMHNQCDEFNAQLRSAGVFYMDRTFAARFPVAFVIAGTGVVNRVALALHRLPLQHVPDDSQDPRMRRALVQSVEFLSSVIASGAVLRYKESDPREEPERGHYARTRTRGSWKFQPLQDDRWESMVSSNSRNGGTVLTSIGLTSREMLTLFDARGSFLTLRNLEA